MADPAHGKRATLVFAGFDPRRWHSSAGGMGELIGGVSEVAWRHNCALHLVRLDAPLDLPLLSGLIKETGSDGLLLRLAGDVLEAHIALLERAAFPYVVIRRYLPERPINCVVPADEVGIRMAVAHLVGLGHCRIGFISAMPNIVLTRDRLRGYFDALRVHGLEREERLLSLADQYGADAGYRCAVQLLGGPARPSAVVVDADMAPGLYQAAADLHLEIPRDLAVVGYDELPEARSLVPSLTCIQTSHYDTGRAAAELLLEQALGRVHSPRRCVVEPTLRVRASCGATPASTGGEGVSLGQTGG